MSTLLKFRRTASCLFLLLVLLLYGCARTSIFALPTLTPQRTACAPRPTRVPAPMEIPAAPGGQPTAAPPPTRGPPPPLPTVQPLPTLAQKPDTIEQALDLALAFEIRTGVVWDDPWCLETLRTDPGRIQVQWYPQRGYEGTQVGRSVPNGPTVVISIKGDLIPFSFPGWNGGKMHGITYEFSRDTGLFWGFRSPAKILPDKGNLKPTHPPRTRKPRPLTPTAQTPPPIFTAAPR